jgi:hypothetical protein
MKLYEVLLEDKKQVKEAPMGMLNTLGNKAMAKMGNARATGKLSTGTLANQLHKEFQTYLGKTGREATKDAVMGFLSSKGYPTQGAATIINQALKGAGAAPSGPLANLKATAKGVATSAKDAMKKVGSTVADKLKPELKAAPIDKTEPTMGDETPTTTSPADTTAAAPAKTGSFNNQLGGGKASYSQATHFDPTTMKNATTPVAAGGVPSTSNPTTAPKQLDPRDLNKNGEVDATEKSIARNKSKKKVSASKINTGNMVAEAGPGVLPQSIIDKAILKAAQEAEILNNKQGKTSAQQASAGGIQPTAQGNAPADAEPASGTASSGGFGAGLKKGFTGKAKASPDIASLEQRIAAIEKKVGLA